MFSRYVFYVSTVIATFFAAPIALCSEGHEAANRVSEGSLTARSILEALDPECLGCGPDAYHDESVPHPMAFSLLASTGAILEDIDLTETSANWLVDHIYPQGGWGLGFEWDAFGDKSINPSDTVYGITTALAVGGLLDAYEFTGTQRYLDVAERALVFYSKAFNETEHGGCFWYSEQPSDSICVYNVTSMLAGKYARAGSILNRQDFRRLADLAASHLLKMTDAADDFLYWSYSKQNRRPNDAVHAAYSVQGLIEYRRYSGKPVDLLRHGRYLSSFREDDKVKEFSPLHKTLDDTLASRPARLWGLGMLIYTLSELGDEATADWYASRLNDYISERDKIFLSVPGGDKANVRMITHVAIGVAKLHSSRIAIYGNGLP